MVLFKTNNRFIFYKTIFNILNPQLSKALIINQNF